MNRIYALPFSRKKNFKLIFSSKSKAKACSVFPMDFLGFLKLPLFALEKQMDKYFLPKPMTLN